MDVCACLCVCVCVCVCVHMLGGIYQYVYFSVYVQRGVCSVYTPVEDKLVNTACEHLCISLFLCVKGGLCSV